MYQFIRSHGGWDNWAMLKVCDFLCDNKIELTTEERRHMTLLRADLNKAVPTRTKKEYYEDNKDEMLEKQKQYYEVNKNVIAKKQKQYYEDNRDEMLEKQKQYYEDNKDKISEKQNQKYTCNCGGCYTNANKASHVKTKKHLSLSSRKQTEIII